MLSRKRSLMVLGLAALGGLLAVWLPSTRGQDESSREELAPLELPAARQTKAAFFVTSGACKTCHSNAEKTEAMRDRSGRNVAPYDLWSATMMANAARDPLWRAVASLEIAVNPKHAHEVEAKCLGCHAPLASVELQLREEPSLTFATLGQDSVRGQLALDGVACTLCHQIQPGNLGKPESFTGGYQIGKGKFLYGPHAKPLVGPMQSMVDFIPKHGPHMRKPELCATCHTLVNEAYRADGTLTGRLFAEQAQYLEWKNSWFATSDEQVTCQDCHVPTHDPDGLPIHTLLARQPDGKDYPHGVVGERSPFGRHQFVGGNSFMLSILRDNADLLKPTASRAAFDVQIKRTRVQLQQRTARLWIGAGKREGGLLQFMLRVENRTGHKFPTGHPTRRAWLRVEVWDARGDLLFASGRFDQRGRIVTEAGNPLPSEEAGGPLRPHRLVIQEPNDVQVYEGVMEDDAGALCYLLTQAAMFRKDNRLLPMGWRLDHDDAVSTAPKGIGGDTDFVGGEDQVLYRVAVGDRPGPFRIEAALLFQSLGTRYANELFAHPKATPEMAAFRRLYEAADRTPEPIASATASVPAN